VTVSINWRGIYYEVASQPVAALWAPLISHLHSFTCQPLWSQQPNLSAYWPAVASIATPLMTRWPCMWPSYSSSHSTTCVSLPHSSQLCNLANQPASQQPHYPNGNPHLWPAWQRQPYPLSWPASQFGGIHDIYIPMTLCVTLFICIMLIT